MIIIPRTILLLEVFAKGLLNCTSVGAGLHQHLGSTYAHHNGQITSYQITGPSQFCIRCCKIAGQCNLNNDRYGCDIAIPGVYYTGTFDNGVANLPTVPNGGGAAPLSYISGPTTVPAPANQGGTPPTYASPAAPSPSVLAIANTPSASVATTPSPTSNPNGLTPLHVSNPNSSASSTTSLVYGHVSWFSLWLALFSIALGLVVRV